MLPELPHHADTTYVAFSNPLHQSLHFFGLELVVFTCFALTLHHALGHYAKGDRYPVFQWLSIFAYGVLIELLAFNYYQNYQHGLFTIQLYHRMLPLYVTALYVVFHYTGLKLIERLSLGLLAEALLVGFMICLLDVPFDIAGPDARWWSWSTSDPKLAYRWLGVPVTSYYWYLVFGGIFAALSRLLRRKIEPRSLAVYFLVAPLVGVAIIFFGTLLFLPFHGLKALGVSDGLIVAAHLALCAAVALFSRRAPAKVPSWQFLFIPGAIYAWHVGVILLLFTRGEVAHATTKALAILSASLGSWLLVSSRGLRQIPMLAPIGESAGFLTTAPTQSIKSETRSTRGLDT